MNRAEKCFWVDNDSYWKTSCGWEIPDKETSAYWKFCPWCGKPIKDKGNALN